MSKLTLDSFEILLMVQAMRKRPLGLALSKAETEAYNLYASIQNREARSGPGLGEKVPDFELKDQQGKNRRLADLTGPKGLLLCFVRSADW